MITLCCTFNSAPLRSNVSVAWANWFCLCFLGRKSFFIEFGWFTFFSTSLDFSCMMWLEAMGKVRSNTTGVFSWPGTDGFSWEKSKNDQSQKFIKRNFQPKTVRDFTCMFGNYSLLWSRILISREKDHGQVHNEIHSVLNRRHKVS